MEETLIKRVLPHSIEAEQSVIGSMLMDREAVIAASEIITGSDFYQQQYGIMFDAMVELFNEGKPVDLVTLQDRLKEKDVPPEVSSLDFVRDIIMKAPSKDMMNTLARSVLTLYSYDNRGDDISIPNVLRQSLQLIAKMPQIAVHSYCAYRHFHADDTLVIRLPNKEMSIAENILQMLRPDGEFTELEAKVLDVALVLHAEHGGGNNSTFTNHVVTSSGTDTYSATAASIASLKGPRHGGANLKVQQMFADIKEHCPDYEDEKTLTRYLEDMLDKKVFDKSGLIYGMGHAVYTLSDPREVILKEYAKRLSEEKGMQREYGLYERVERLAGEAIAKKRHLFKPICANVDFYSGFVYSMLGIPEELYTPIFAISRISGWSAHRLEEVVNNGKIIRPAYKYVGYHRPYCALDERHE